MPEINLAAEVFRARLIARRQRLLYVVSGGIALVLLGAWAVPVWFTRAVRAQIQDTETQTVAIEARLNERREEVRSLVLFQRRLSLLQQHLDGRVGWSLVVSSLERLTPPDVVYRSLRGSVASSTIDATVVVNSLDAAADLVASLQQGPGETEKPFGIVEVTSVQSNEASTEAGNFLVHLRIPVNPSAFAVGATHGDAS